MECWFIVARLKHGMEARQPPSDCVIASVLP
jgi:hypothetical protein